MDPGSAPPVKLARLSDAVMLSMNAPSLALGLCLGPSAKSAFTFLQLQELELQALIFKYMVDGIPVPLHLVLPIWKSLVGATGGLHMQHPPWLGSSSLCFDYRNSMEPEPGRCRRTDGKKWRCSKDVVPDQKYCERHMHRGRQRSRKPVEGNSSSNTAAAVQTAANDHVDDLSISIELMASNPVAASAAAIAGNSSRLGFSRTSVLQPTACRMDSCH